MNAGKNEIPRRPLLWLAAALVFTVPPMFKALSLWVPVLFLAALVAKFPMERRGLRLRNMVLKLACVAACVGAVQMTYHALIGLESGLSIMMGFCAFKILESHTARDFHVLALIGWFLSLAGLFISQDLSAGIYAIIAFTLILASVVQFHRGSAAGKFAAVWTSLGLVLRAMPLVLVLFFLFPRGSGPLRFDLRNPFLNRPGMSNELKPGSVASLALSTDVAFRVEFPDGNMPPLSRLYWRANVFTQDLGLSWNIGIADEYRRPPERLGTGAIRQQIILQPHGGYWVFALEWAGEAPAKTRMLRGNVLRTDRPVFGQWRYEVTSYSSNREVEIEPTDMRSYLQLPRAISPRVHELVESWRQSSTDPRAIAASALAYFHNEKFRYTISPGEYTENGIDDFLFHRRLGFCEHYAAAFATLMRVAGIPSRVVTGYQGGQFNTLGSYLVVHQSDAHAWCEIWLKGSGWQRYDPTAAVAPDRVSMGFTNFMEQTAAAGGAGDGTGQFSGTWKKQPLLRYIQLAWETVSYEWDSRVANFDDEAQQSFLLAMGWINTRALVLLGWLLVIGFGVFAVQSLLTWWRTREVRDPLKACYEGFCRRIAALGVEREPWEGPRHFAERAAALLPGHAPGIRRVADIYISLSYEATSGGRALEEMAREVRGLAGAGKR